MAEKKKVKKESQRATNSFANLLAEAERTKLQPFIDQMNQVISQISQQNRMLKAEMDRTFDDLFLRVATLEKVAMQVTNMTEDDLSEMMLNVEDEFLGFTKTEDPAEEGDFLRTKIMIKKEDETEYSKDSEQNFSFKDLGKQMVINAEIDKALIGMKAGDEKEIEHNANGQKVKLLVKATRVSKRPKEIKEGVKVDESVDAK